ncbi:hypothetical protein GC207_08450 [bacterium]|nr:hypothetical protein [bacterium]
MRRFIELALIWVLTLFSGLWLAFYAHALWPFAMSALRERDPAMVYDPFFQIARHIDLETGAMTEWRVEPFVFADAPTGTIQVSFSMPCWPLTLAAVIGFSIGCYGVLFWNRRPVSPSA